MGQGRGRYSVAQILTVFCRVILRTLLKQRHCVIFTLYLLESTEMLPTRKHSLEDFV